MIDHNVRVHASSESLPVSGQLAWKLAEVATDPVGVEPDVAEMIVNRIIDNAGVAAAALSRPPVAHAAAQALAHPYAPGARLFGAGRGVRLSPEWAAWANNVAVRELDFHDTFLAAEYAHPGDNIPPLLAVAQHRGRSGAELLSAIATAYEVQIDLSKGICLHEYRIDHIAHLGPSVAAGLACLLSAPTPVAYQAIGQALHTTTTTRQSRKGQISSWKAYAPAFAGKMGIEALDRALRGEGSPAPIYEGEDGFLAWMLRAGERSYTVPLPGPGEPKRAILESYTKAHSAEYQAQALIDLAGRMRAGLDLAAVRSITIETSAHTHDVIGTGSGDPDKFDPDASRETLDHSLMYIFAVALEDGTFHHERSYAPERAHRPETVALWQKITTREDPTWSARYHAPDPADRAFGGRVLIEMEDGTMRADEIAVADAHPAGARPFGRAEYLDKFTTLCEGVVAKDEQERFVELVTRLAELSADELGGLSLEAVPGALDTPAAHDPGLF